MKRRAMAVLLALCMALSLLPGAAMAAAPTTEGQNQTTEGDDGLTSDDAADAEDEADVEDVADGNGLPSSGATDEDASEVTDEDEVTKDVADGNGLPSPAAADVEEDGIAALASEDGGVTIVKSGNCGITGNDGNSVTWALDDTGLLTISGNGDMRNYNDPGTEQYGTSPWGRITSVVIESGVTSIGSYAFAGEMETLVEATIPDTVKSIGKGAFSWCQKLKSITIPDSVTSIGEGAFDWCIELESVAISKNVTRIEDNMFNQCLKLKNVTIHNGVTYIGSHAFYNCNIAGSINIPSSVERIGGTAFYSNYGLKDVYYNGTRAQWKTVANMGTLVPAFQDNIKTKFHCTDDPWVSYDANGGEGTMPGERFPQGGTLPVCTFTPPEGMVFNGWNVGGVAYSTRWYSAGDVATISKDTVVKAVWRDARIVTEGYCGTYPYPYDIFDVTWTLYNDGNFTISGNNRMQDFVEPKPNFANTAPWKDKASSIVSVTIEQDVQNIGTYAFYGCSNLTSVKLSDRITDIGEYAFYGCSNLTSVTLPSGITTIGRNAFNNCDKLDIYYSGSRAQWNTIQGKSNIKNTVKIYCSDDPTVTYDANNGSGTMESCLFTMNDVLPECGFSPPAGKKFKAWDINGEEYVPGDRVDISVDIKIIKAIWIDKNIVTYGFYGADANSQNVKWMLDEEGRLTISGKGQMKDINSIQGAPWFYRETDDVPDVISAIIEKGITNIGKNAFCYHYGDEQRKLESIIIPDSVTRIGEYAFDACSQLTSIIIPNSVTQIGRGAFAYCSQLTSIVLPINITAIEDRTFSSCSQLKSITIPAGVTDIGQMAFSGCSSLSDVYYSGTKAQWEAIRVDSEGNDALKKATIHYVSVVSYDANGGSGNMESAILANNAKYILPECTFSAPEGTLFKAWSVNGVEYAPGVNLNISADTTVKAIWEKIKTVTISYDANGGSGTMASVAIRMNDKYVLPKCDFVAPDGRKFKAWSVNGTEYARGISLNISADTTVKAVWQAVDKYLLTGKIIGGENVTTYASVSANLVGLDGKKYAATVTANDIQNNRKQYTYSVSAPAGQYSLEVEAKAGAAGEATKRTAMINLKGNGQTKDITLPNGQVKSVVSANDGVKALVDGLDALIMNDNGEVYGGTSAEVTMTIDRVDNPTQTQTSAQATAADKIKKAAPKQTLNFFDFSIKKKVDGGAETSITDTGNATVAIVLPFDNYGKKNITVYRYHGSDVNTLTTTEKDGEKIELTEDSITIYAKKFSMYAVGYEENEETPSSGGNTGSSSGGGGNSSSPGSNNTNSVPTVKEPSQPVPVLPNPDKQQAEPAKKKINKVPSTKKDNEVTKEPSVEDADAAEDTKPTELASAADTTEQPKAEDAGSQTGDENKADKPLSDEAVLQSGGGMSAWLIIGLCALIAVVAGAAAAGYLRKKRSDN